VEVASASRTIATRTPPQSLSLTNSVLVSPGQVRSGLTNKDYGCFPSSEVQCAEFDSR
jgi:hypothetical protein